MSYIDHAIMALKAEILDMEEVVILVESDGADTEEEEAHYEWAVERLEPLRMIVRSLEALE